MIERGQCTFSHLNLHLIDLTGKIPLEDQSVDGVILSTVIYCNPNKNAQEKIILEIHRLLKNKGILYLCDFLITCSEKYSSQYEKHAKPSSEDYGIYVTREGVAVRHHSMHWIFNILKQFDIQWLEQFDDVTMNGNSVRTFHLIAQKL